jgi:hypothetical protein
MSLTPIHDHPDWGLAYILSEVERGRTHQNARKAYKASCVGKVDEDAVVGLYQRLHGLLRTLEAVYDMSEVPER